MLGAACAFGAPRRLQPRRARRRSTVYVNSYGGVWETSWRKAFFDPFTAQTGIEIKTVPGVSFAKLKAEVQTGNYECDQCNLGDSRIRIRPCTKDCSKKVDKEAAKADQLPPNLVREFGIVSYSLGTNHRLSQGQVPERRTAKLGRFLGREEISRTALPVRPLVYVSRLRVARRRRAQPTSSIRWIIDRAFRKMDEIKPHIKVWWRDGAQSQQLIRDAEVEHDRHVERACDRPYRRQSAARAGLERCRTLLVESDRA